jgi:hypothetical protein
MNARIQTHADPLLQPGRDVYAQYWTRDPADPWTTGLTDAISFRILP